MPRRMTVLVACGLAGCFGEPPPSSGGGTATDDVSGTASSSAAGTIDPETSMSTTIDPSDTAVMTTEPATSGTFGEVTSGQPTSSGDSGIVTDAFCDAVAERIIGVQACQDFDGSAGVLGNWTEVEESGANVDVIADDAAPSPPNVVDASFDEMAGRLPHAAVVTELRILTAPFHLRFRMELSACDGETTLVRVTYVGVNFFQASLVHTGSMLVLDVLDGKGDVMRHPLDTAVLDNAGPWAEYGFDIDVAEAYVDVLVEGEYAVQVPDLAPPAVPPFAPSIELGVVGSGPNYACGVRFDDIVAY